MPALTFEEYCNFDGIGLAELIRKEEVTVAEVVEAALAAAAALNPKLNAIAIDLSEFARAAASQGRTDAPFSGVPFLLKNQGAQAAGLPLTFGSRFFEDYVPDFDATIFTRFQEAGLIPIGRSNTPELSLTPITEPQLYGPTINPRAPDKITGGSSGGAASAVAAGIVPLAHATDGGGSIRQPASCCGLFGLKPSRGRSPFGPKLGEGWNGLSTQLVVSRSVRDSAAALDAIDAISPGDPYTAPAKQRPYLADGTSGRPPLRILVSNDLGTGGTIDSECIQAVDMAAKLCSDLGHQVEYKDVRLEFDWLRNIIDVVYSTHTAQLISQREKLLGRTAGSDELETVTHALVARGKSHTAQSYVSAVGRLHELGRLHARMMSGYDAWLTFTMSVRPPEAGMQMARMSSVDDYISTILDMMPVTAFQNITGQPAMSFPIHQTAEGIPIGCHFTAPYGRDDTLFRLAYELEEALEGLSRISPPAASDTYLCR